MNGIGLIILMVIVSIGLKYINDNPNTTVIDDIKAKFISVDEVFLVSLLLVSGIIVCWENLFWLFFRIWD